MVVVEMRVCESVSATASVSVSVSVCVCVCERERERESVLWGLGVGTMVWMVVGVQENA